VWEEKTTLILLLQLTKLMEGTSNYNIAFEAHSIEILTQHIKLTFNIALEAHSI
jgi:hypothetical protein